VVDAEQLQRLASQGTWLQERKYQLWKDHSACKSWKVSIPTLPNAAVLHADAGALMACSDYFKARLLSGMADQSKLVIEDCKGDVMLAPVDALYSTAPLRSVLALRSV
jgi:hypothetical protein